MSQKSIDIPSLPQYAPIPGACRVGPFLATSAVWGSNASGQLPPDGEAQVQNAFQNLKLLLEAAGMDLGDVVKLTVFVSADIRESVNKWWDHHYPDTTRRPARTHVPTQLPSGRLVQLEALAVAKDGAGAS
jgi:2-iminobutanoate/2-iminopropanoate deaminase